MLQHFSATVAMTRRSRHRPKSRKPKYLSLRRHLAPASPATAAPAPSEERSASSTCDMSTSGAASVAGAGEDDDRVEGPQHLEPSPLHPTDHLDRDPHVASLLLLDDGHRSIAALFGDDDGAAASSGSPPAADSPASSSMNWDGLARRALRGRERWVYCHSSSSLPAASSSGDEEASSAAAGGGGGGPGRGVADHRWRFAGAAGQSQALALKLDYEEILAAWSDRGPLYIEGDAPQVVPQLHGEPYYAFPVMVEVGPSEAWRVPEFVGGPAAAAAGEEERSREERVRRYKEKRRSRLFAKRIRYQVRKQNAEKRPRFKGRFVRRKDYSKDLLLSQ